MSIQSFFGNQAIAAHGDTHLSLTCRDLDLTVTHAMFDDGKQAYVAGDYTRAVDIFTQALNSLHANVTSVILLHRAAAHEMTHDYASALRDSDDAYLNGNSSRPDAYFAKGNALIFQDHLKSAADIFKRGVDNVAVTHPARTQLLRRHEQLRAEMDRRNRWMMRVLSYEVLSRILSNLSFTDRCELSLTCRFWNNFVLREWSPMWSTIDWHDMSCPGYKADIVLSMVPPDQVKNVRLSLTTAWAHATANTETVSGRIFKTMLERKWNRIESLDFYNNSKMQMIGAIQLTKDTLRSLKLRTCYSERSHSTDAISYAAQACGAIQSIVSTLDAIPHGVGNLDTQITLGPSTLCLKRLQLSYALSPQSLARILNISTGLISLALDCKSYPDSNLADALGTVYTCSPKLQELYYEHISESRDNFTATYTRPDVAADGYDGLRVLQMKNDDTSVAVIDEVLALLLKRSHDTLETLFLYISLKELDDCKSLGVLSKYGARRLRTLDLATAFDVFHNKVFGPKQLSDLLGACSSLEVVRLEDINIWSDSVFQCLGKLQRLEQLDLVLEASDYNSRQISSSAIEALFKETRNLRRLHLDAVWFLGQNLRSDEESILPCIARHIRNCPRLNELKITDIPIRKELKLLEFLSNLKGSQVRKLSFSIECDVYVRDLLALASIDNLEYLEIDDRHNKFTRGKLRRLFHEHQFNRLLVTDIIYNDHDDWVRLNGVKRSVLSAGPSDNDIRQRLSIELVSQTRRDVETDIDYTNGQQLYDDDYETDINYIDWEQLNDDDSETDFSPWKDYI